MADAVDDDTLRAVRARWAEDAATLPTLFDRLPEAGRLKGPRAGPYAQIASAPESSEPASPAAFHDRRKVTITVRGTKAQVTAALAALGEVFNFRTALTLPSGAKFMQWRPRNGGGALELEETQKGGEDVWRGVVEASLWTIRAS